MKGDVERLFEAGRGADPVSNLVDDVFSSTARSSSFLSLLAVAGFTLIVIATLRLLRSGPARVVVREFALTLPEKLLAVRRRAESAPSHTTNSQRSQSRLVAGIYDRLQLRAKPLDLIDLFGDPSEQWFLGLHALADQESRGLRSTLEYA